MGNDTTSSNIDGNGESMIEEIPFAQSQVYFLTGKRHTIKPTGDLKD